MIINQVFIRQIDIVKQKKFDVLIENTLHYMESELELGWYSPIPTDKCSTYETMKDMKGEQKVELIFRLVETIVTTILENEHLQQTHNLEVLNIHLGDSKVEKKYRANQERIWTSLHLLKHLLRKKISFSDEDLAQLLETFATYFYYTGKIHQFQFKWPFSTLVSQIEIHIKKNGLGDSLKSGLKKTLKFSLFKNIENKTSKHYNADLQKTVLKLKYLALSKDEKAPVYQIGDGPFGQIVVTDYKKMSSELQQKWNALFHHFAKAKAGKPSKK